jgi:hypothetical protein
MGPMRPRAPLVVAAIVFLISVGGAAFTVDAESAKPKPLPPRLIYTLSVQLEVQYGLDATGTSETRTVRKHFGFAGGPVRVWFVRRPGRFFLTRPGGTMPATLQVPGFLDFKGTGSWALGDCLYAEGFTLAGDNSTTAKVLLTSAYLSLSITTKATATWHLASANSARCSPFEDETSASLLGLSPGNPQSASATSSKWNLEAVRLGKRFAIVRKLDAVTDPSLRRTWSFENGSGEDSWLYVWKLRFTPVTAR